MFVYPHKHCFNRCLEFILFDQFCCVISLDMMQVTEVKMRESHFTVSGSQ